MFGRSLIPLITPLLLVAMLAGCGETLRARFEAFGNIDAARSAGPAVSSAGDVEVFYATAPAGFSLRDNELTVEPGHNHRILGSVRVLRSPGPCASTEFTKRDVLEHMRTGAFDNGGNAVVYAQSRIADDATPEERCNAFEGELEVGAGWVVVVVEPDDAELTP
jgi:hypothetical protein